PGSAFGAGAGGALLRPGNTPQHGVRRTIPGTSPGLRAQGRIWHPHSDDGPALGEERRLRVGLVQRQLQDARLVATRRDLQPKRPVAENRIRPCALRAIRLARLDQVRGVPHVEPSSEKKTRIRNSNQPNSKYHYY